MATANWHPIKYNNETRQFEGELPVVNNEGYVDVLITEAFGHFVSDYTDECIPEEEDRFIIDGYFVKSATFRDGYFVGQTSSFVKAWDYAPEPFVPYIIDATK